MPKSVALVGASDRPGSLGRSVFENLLAGEFKGDIYAVNPGHRSVFGQRAYAIGRGDRQAGRSGRDRGARGGTVPGLIDDIARRGARRRRDVHAGRDRPRGRARLAPRRVGSGQETQHPAGGSGRLRRHSHRHRPQRDVRHDADAAGRLALVSQSGAVCTAMLDFAAPMHIGFSSVISLGGAIDVSFGELLDALVQDPVTDGILLYVESVGDARAFLSALRAAARIKPVVVLKAGRSLEPARDAADDARHRADRRTRCSTPRCMRAGTVRVRTYTQLFAAARILAMGKIPGGNRLAIVSNGRGPGLLAADSAVATGVALAGLEPATVQALDALLPKEIVRANPVDVRADAPPARLAAAVAATLSDPQVDAVLALHVTRPITPAIDAARAVAAVARGFDQARAGLLARRARPAGRARGAGRRRHRQFLHAGERRGGVLLSRRLSPQPGMAARGAAAAGRSRSRPTSRRPRRILRARRAARPRGALPLMDAHALLAAFGIALPHAGRGRDARRGARRGSQARLSGAPGARLSPDPRIRRRAAAFAAGARWRAPMAN